MSSTRHTYISPHLDDAVLSCGATIARQIAAGELVEVLTVFAGCPLPASLSDYALQLHQAAGDPDDMMGTRRAEDRAACGELGAQPIHLDYLDAPYRIDPSDRAFLYTSDDQLMGWEVRTADLALADELTAYLARRCREEATALLYAPLGAGGHVDHLLVREAALALESAGQPLLFYEDYPYVEDGHQLVAALSIPVEGGWSAELRPADEYHVSRKCEAIACYRSQVPVLFGDMDSMGQRVKQYMNLVDRCHRYAERFWIRRGEPTSRRQ